MQDPRMAPPAPPTDGPDHQHSDYQGLVDQWSAAPVPAPAQLLKLLMTPGFLTKHQMDAIKALMTAPGQPPQGQTQAQPPVQPNPMGRPPV